MEIKNTFLIFILFLMNPIYGQWEKLPELVNNDLFDIEVVENGNELFVVFAASESSSEQDLASNNLL